MRCGEPDVSELYEFRIAGTIGPTVQACLGRLSTIAESADTVLLGVARDPDDLNRLLTLLDAKGAPALDLWITAEAAPAQSGQPGVTLSDV
jgi:hypothetical protein